MLHRSAWVTVWYYQRKHGLWGFLSFSIWRKSRKICQIFPSPVKSQYDNVIAALPIKSAQEYGRQERREAPAAQCFATCPQCHARPTWFWSNFDFVVCVCTFSKEVKPVFCLDDLLHERISFQFSPLAFTWWTGVNEYFLQFWMSRGCQGHQWVWHQRRHSLFACDMKKGRFLHVPASTTWTWWSNFVWLGSFLVFLFQAVGLQLPRNIFFHDFGTWCLSFCTSV